VILLDFTPYTLVHCCALIEPRLYLLHFLELRQLARFFRGNPCAETALKLLDQIRQVARVKHLAYRTEKAYAYWVEHFLRFHRSKHPHTMGAAEVEAFLTDLAVKGRVAASTHNQVLGAFLFLYRDVLGMEIGDLNAVRARRPQRVPLVLSRAAVQ
jgi:Phage integrase, N-terminal SAM-like domain